MDAARRRAAPPPPELSVALLGAVGLLQVERICVSSRGSHGEALPGRPAGQSFATIPPTVTRRFPAPFLPIAPRPALRRR